MVYLSDLSRSALIMLRKSKQESQGRKEFNPRSQLTAVLNPADGPSRLVGLSYDEAMTAEAIEAALEGSKQNAELSAEDVAGSFWLVVAFATTFATRLPLQKADVDAAIDFLNKS